MSLESDLDKLLEGEESIISVPILFKEKLGIGDKAYAFVRARDKLTTFAESTPGAPPINKPLPF